MNEEYDFIKMDEDDDDEEEDEKKAGFNPVAKKVESQLIDKRMIFLWGGVHDTSAKDIVSKLLYLEANAPGEPIHFFINSPGGVVTSGYAIMDAMKLISSPVHTICMGLAASMGSILLSAGEKGRRAIFPNGEVMIHQPSIGRLQGNASDIEIHAKQMLKARDTASKILAENCGQSVEQINADFDRDYWMDADESIKYGIVDKIYDKLPL